MNEEKIFTSFYLLFCQCYLEVKIKNSLADKMLIPHKSSVPYVR